MNQPKKRGAAFGNQYAARAKIVRQELMTAMAENPHLLPEAALKVLQNAADGDLGSFVVLRDTVDGKPAQALHISDGASGKNAEELTPEELRAELTRVRTALGRAVTQDGSADGADPVH